MRPPFAPPRLSDPRKVDADAHAVETSWEIDSPDSRILAFRAAISCCPIAQIRCGNRVLPQQDLLRNERAQVSQEGPHVAVRQLVPRLGEGVGELMRIREEALRDRLVLRVNPQGEVRRQHGRGVPPLRVVGIGDGCRCGSVLRPPLVRTSRALVELPLVAEQILQEIVAPFRRGGGPYALQPAGDRLAAVTAAKGVIPAQALLLDASPFGLWADKLARIACAMSFTERVAAGNERNGFLVVHRHAPERLADIPRGGDRVWLSVGAFWVDIYEPHLHGAKRIFEMTIAGVAFVRQPLALGTPEMSSSGSQTSSRPPAKPKVLKPIDFNATFPARIIKWAQDSLRPYFCFTGQSNRRALSRFPLSGQLLRGANRCVPWPAPPRPSAIR